MFERLEDLLWDPERMFSSDTSTPTLAKDWPDTWPKNVDIVWKDFVIPQDVLDTIALVRTSPKASMLSLPLDLILEIFSHLSRTSGICLALTCKSLLQASTLAVRHRPTLPPERRIPFEDFEGSVFSLTSPEHNTRRIMITFLFRIHPIREGERRSMAVDLCRDCLRYRPTKVSWWADKGARCPGKPTFGSKWDAIVEKWSGKQVLQ
ncbi:hypothetical protein V8C37DRAFT_402818 [Trichoderma ceciliae]